MSETVRTKAQDTLPLVEEVNAVVLAEPGDADAVVALDQADPQAREEIRSRMDEIDMGDTQSIVSFGSAAQAELQTISQAMLTDVRNKVDDARRDLPSEADEPNVNEVNISEFPVLVVTLSGEVPVMKSWWLEVARSHQAW